MNLFLQVFLILCIVFLLGIIFEMDTGKVWNFHKMRQPHLYDDPHLLVPMPRRHTEMVRQGRRIAKHQTLIITGLCRDVAKHIEKNIRRAVLIGELFKDYRIVLYENDSTDGTRKVLENMAKRNRKIRLIDDLKEEKTPELYSYGTYNSKRIDRMAYLRNIYMRYIRRNFPKYDYLLVSDFDIEGYTNLTGVLHVIGKRGNWDAVAVNGQMNIPGTFGSLTSMYDTLAFVKDPKDMAACQQTNYGFVQGMNDWLTLGQVTARNFVPVASAFNGMCLYKMPSVISCKYPTGWRCEHIGLHAEMAKIGKGRIYLDPFWVVYVGHQGPPSIFRLLFV